MKLCESCGELEIPDDAECCDICEHEAYIAEMEYIDSHAFGHDGSVVRHCKCEDYPCCGH